MPVDDYRHACGATHDRRVQEPVLRCDMTRFAQSSSGAVAVMTALVMPLLLGFGSIGVEVGHWYLYEREMQGAADAAAISAASQYITDEIASNGTTASTA